MMTLVYQTDIFKPNVFFWKMFGIWADRKSSKTYKYYSFVFLFITLIMYNSLLAINLLYTPLKIELLIREVIFCFTEITVSTKVLMILFKRNKILDAFDLLNKNEFRGNSEESSAIIQKNNSAYKTYWKLYAILSNFAYSSQVLGPLIVKLIWKTKLELPICNYYFLNEELRHDFFSGWYIYQSFGMYGHMMYNVNIDTFISGLLMMAVTQLKIIQTKLLSLKLNPRERKMDRGLMNITEVLKLNEILKHYELVLKYCSTVQSILDVAMFVQFGVASAIICVAMCGLIMVRSSTETLLFMVTYLFAMTLQIFVPAWMGTQLHFQSQELVFAAYNSEWIPRCQSFKRSIIIFVERAKIPITITGLKMFPLSLATFTSIMKTAYSFFTLIRNMQALQEE
ncbi:olfactory receptor 15 [Bombyx mori]|uniref:Odorant receptor n=1 Tax=Bombyx mori TaxID=7091 RepID=Q0EEF6_BOMMO|nr:olfactory receptor 15 [Bombyx mori]BAF31194.1 candidate olfactory receptor [Bombyx mori]